MIAAETRKPKFVEQQAEELRLHILDATRRFLVEKGYSALTMRALAAECRVSVPTLYRKFGGKQELVLEAVRDQFRSAILGQVLDAAGK